MKDGQMSFDYSVGSEATATPYHRKDLKIRPKTADPEFLAQYLLHVFSGMMVLGKSKKGKAEVRKLKEFVLSSILRL